MGTADTWPAAFSHVRLEAIPQNKLRTQTIVIHPSHTVRISHLDKGWEKLRPFHIPLCLKNNVLSLTLGRDQENISEESPEVTHGTRAALTILGGAKTNITNLTSQEFSPQFWGLSRRLMQTWRRWRDFIVQLWRKMAWLYTALQNMLCKFETCCALSMWVYKTHFGSKNKELLVMKGSFLKSLTVTSTYIQPDSASFIDFYTHFLKRKSLSKLQGLFSPLICFLAF